MQYAVIRAQLVPRMRFVEKQGPLPECLQYLMGRCGNDAKTSAVSALGISIIPAGEENLCLGNSSKDAANIVEQ